MSGEVKKDAGGEDAAEAAFRMPGKRLRKMRYLKALVYATGTIFCLIGLGKVGATLGAVVLLVAALGLGIAAMGQFVQEAFDVSDKRKAQPENAQDDAAGTVGPSSSQRQEVTPVASSSAEQLTEVAVVPATQAEADNLEQFAEAALLALGQRITWSQPMPYADSNFWLGRVKETAGGDMYTVRYDKPPASVLAISPTYVSLTPCAAAAIGGEEGGPQSVIIGGKKDVPQHKYRTVEDAKAACERYHATGK